MPMTLEEAISIWKPEVSNQETRRGERTVTYRDLAGQNHKLVTKDPEEAHAKFLEWVENLRAEIATLRR